VVAVKENLFLAEEYTRQFQREANIMASLHHVSLPRVGDYFFIQGQGQYMIMDFIQGEDLRQRIERLGNIPERDMILIGSLICDALSYLHSRPVPIIHRDIKPGNIKITPEGQVFLVDFGLAKLMEGSQVTTTGARAMTPGYSPPEQYGPGHTDARSDIYSLGATLYAALSGIIPEDGLARMTGKADLTPIRQLQPKISRKLAMVIDRSLQLEPDDRYQTADELKVALLEAGDMTQLLHTPITVAPPPPEVLEEQPKLNNHDQPITPGPNGEKEKARKKAQRRPKKRRVPVLALIAAMLVGIIAGAIYLQPTLPTTLYGLVSGWVNPTVVTTFNPTATITEQVSRTPVPIRPTQENIEATEATSTETPEATVAMTETEAPATEPTAMATLEPLISFVSDRTGSMQVWLMDMNGENEWQLTNIDSGACQPNWSPDGKQFAIISPCTAKSFPYYTEAQIYLVNADGSDPQPLPISGPGDFDPAWSPDGMKIAFSSLRSGVAHIYVYNLATGKIEELSDTRFADIQPSWNPNGKQIAFSRKEVYSHISMMSTTGQTQFIFSLPGSVNDYWPIWTPDGTSLFYGKISDSFVPWLVEMNYEDRGVGPEIRVPPLTSSDAGKPIYDAALSPDGQWLAFEGWPDGQNHDIYLMDVDGENLLRLTTDPGYDFDAAWVPVTKP
ncbi:MAG: protein kinase, partial [Anaerolineae bacterium]|nr:protein kinase [Anaerolineae bacterium]